MFRTSVCGGLASTSALALLVSLSFAGAAQAQCALTNSDLQCFSDDADGFQDQGLDSVTVAILTDVTVSHDGVALDLGDNVTIANAGGVVIGNALTPDADVHWWYEDGMAFIP